MTDHPLSRRIAHVLDLQPHAPAIEYAGQWISWSRVADLARHVQALAGQSTDAQIGMLLRNRPGHVAAFLGVLLGGATVVTINPSRGEERTRAEIAELRLPLVIGERNDLDTLAAPTTNALPIPALLDEAPASPASTPPSGSAPSPGVAVRMLTSGTTGLPKRIDLSYDMLARSVLGPDPDRAPAPTELRRGVAIVNSPLVHIGGVFRVLQCVVEARSFVLLDRFELNVWAAAVRKHRPRTVSLVPAALRTVLHSDLTRADLESLRAVTCGTAPLSADDADAFTEKYGVPVLTSYAATEFGGGVAGWTLPDYQQHWRAKRGSVGRANPGSKLRVVDEDGVPLGTDRVGLLEVRAAQLGPSTRWIRTTDMARIDEDGFVWIAGRADQAIIRGGFKVMPDDVRAALETHPSVAGAAVVARSDDRLGQTPVAMVELRESASVDTEQLLEYLRVRLARYEIPTDIAIVGAIPRTPSGKPDLNVVQSFFNAATHSDHGR